MHYCDPTRYGADFPLPAILLNAESYTNTTNTKGPTRRGRRRRPVNFPRNHPLDDISRVRWHDSWTTFCSVEDERLSFLHISQAMGQKPVKWWSIPPPPLDARVFVGCPPDNLLVVTEEKEPCVPLGYDERHRRTLNRDRMCAHAGM